MYRALYFLSVAALLATSPTAADGPATLVFDRKAGHLYYYKGTVTLEGVAERRTDKQTLEIGGDNLCFSVDATSSKLIPREGDERAPWFCFRDRTAAIRSLRLPAEPGKGSCGYRVAATVVVGSYVANRLESAVFDTAELFSVKNRGVMQPIPCA
jgi:hypothetical protein